MIGKRFTKQIPEFIYFIGEGEWVMGPYVRPQRNKPNRKFKITQVSTDETNGENKYLDLKNTLEKFVCGLEILIKDPVGNPREEGIDFCCGFLQEILKKH